MCELIVGPDRLPPEGWLQAVVYAKDTFVFDDLRDTIYRTFVLSSAVPIL